MLGKHLLARSVSQESITLKNSAYWMESPKSTADPLAQESEFDSTRDPYCYVTNYPASSQAPLQTSTAPHLNTKTPKHQNTKTPRASTHPGSSPFSTSPTLPFYFSSTCTTIASSIRVPVVEERGRTECWIEQE